MLPPDRKQKTPNSKGIHSESAAQINLIIQRHPALQTTLGHSPLAALQVNLPSPSRSNPPLSLGAQSDGPDSGICSPQVKAPFLGHQIAGFLLCAKVWAT